MIVRALSAHLYSNNNNNNNDKKEKKNEKRSPNEKQYHYNRHNNTESINNYSHKITSMKVATSNSLIFRTELRGTFLFCFHHDLFLFFFGGSGFIFNQYTQLIVWPLHFSFLYIFFYSLGMSCGPDTRFVFFFVSSLSIELNFEWYACTGTYTECCDFFFFFVHFGYVQFSIVLTEH